MTAKPSAWARFSSKLIAASLHMPMALTFQQTPGPLCPNAALCQSCSATCPSSPLMLLNTAQPALKPLTSLATATVSAIAKRNENVQIHTFELGLDFDGSATSARLRYGSYIVVQTDEGSNWDWSDYKWNANGMAMHPAGTPSETPGFNYMVFAVSPFSPAASMI